MTNHNKAGTQKIRLPRLTRDSRDWESRDYRAAGSGPIGVHSSASRKAECDGQSTSQRSAYAEAVKADRVGAREPNFGCWLGVTQGVFRLAGSVPNECTLGLWVQADRPRAPGRAR